MKPAGPGDAPREPRAPEENALDLWGASAPASRPAAERSELLTLTVSQLTRKIRAALEGAVGEVWVRGEISNLRAPGSGHLYFTLKDGEAVLNAVMFRGDSSRLAAPLRDGQAVRIRGRVTVYEPRGQYQIQVLEARPEGLGTLQERFEALKRKLAEEGLFDPERKRPLPVFPERVGLVTSLQGAVIEDFCRILGRRAPGIVIEVRGVRVQGDGSAAEIAAAVAAFSGEGRVAAIVVARGGGSLEDLWAFNEEEVARALAASQIPTISAVGHETDFTIADFVADLRAPTPSAAAELVSRAWAEWRDLVDAHAARLGRAARQRLAFERERWRSLGGNPVFREPRRVLARAAQRVDDLREELARGLRRAVSDRRRDLGEILSRWEAPALRPAALLARHRERVGHWEARLRALGPEATLARGYAIVLDAGGQLVRRAAAVKPGQALAVRMADGTLPVRSEVRPE